MGKEKGKKGKGKKGKGKIGPTEKEIPPPLMGPTAPESQRACVDSFKQSRSTYEKKWLDRDESGNIKQQHDMELCKDEVAGVEEELRKEVDDILVMQLAHLKKQVESGKK